MIDKQSYLYKGSSIEIEQNSYFGDSVIINGRLIIDKTHFMGYGEGIVIIKKLILPQNDLMYFVWYLIDYLGNKYEVGINYKWITPFKATLAKVTPVQEENGQFGIINKKGNFIVPCILNVDEITSYGDDNFARVVKNGKEGIIDEEGKLIIPCQYDSIYMFRPLIDGKEYAFTFNNDMACVKEGGKWGCINKKGTVIIPCIYESISINDYGIAKVIKDKECKYLDKSGKTLFVNKNINQNYDIVAAKEGFIIVKHKGKYGLLGKTGNEIIPCIHNTIDDLRNCSVNNTSYDNNDVAFFCRKRQDVLICNKENNSYGIFKTPVFQNEQIRGYIEVICEGNKCTNNMIIKKYGKQKENVLPDGTISFKCVDGSFLPFDYMGGYVTYLPSLKKWVSTAHFAVSDKDLPKILQEGTTVTTQQGETLSVNAAYDGYLCLKYLVCPIACTDKQKAYLQDIVDKEKQEAEQKAAELEAKQKAAELEEKQKAAELEEKRQEEERKAAEEKAKAEAISAAERSAKEREQQKQNSGCASVIILAIIIAYFLL